MEWSESKDEIITLRKKQTVKLYDLLGITNHQLLIAAIRFYHF